jgi:hypothetical protein
MSTDIQKELVQVIRTLEQLQVSTINAAAAHQLNKEAPTRNSEQ